MLMRLRNLLFSRPRRTLAVIFLAALLARLLIGAFFYNEFDLKGYNIPWALGMQEGVFSCYRNIEKLNYPPLFPALLTFVSPLVAFAQREGSRELLMLGIKLIPILFDVGTLLALYFCLEKESKKKALLAAAIWAVNPVTFFNCAFWGQADSMLAFFIVLTFFAFQKKRPVIGTVFFVLGCLAKLQMLYLAPVVLCELFFRYRPGKAASALGAGVAVGAAGWLPFMIGSGEAWLPFHIYFGGFGQYSTVNMYAYNFYGAPFLLNTSEEAQIFTFGGLTYAQISLFFTVLLVIFVFFSYWYARKKRIAVPAALIAMLYMNGMFMLTTKQHERYQIPVMVLAALCWLFLKEKRFRLPFAALLVLPFMNEACGLFHVQLGAWFHTGVFLPMLVVCSILNGLLFFYMLYLYFSAFKTPVQGTLEDRAPQEREAALTAP